MSEEIPTSAGSTDRLQSWKEIAGYLQSSVRSVQRWEHTEGLPVRRHAHEKRGSVYALRSEIDAWWRERGSQLLDKPTRDIAALTTPVRSREFPWAKSWATLVILVVIGVVAWRVRTDLEPAVYPTVTGRRLTSYPGVEMQSSFSPDGNQIAFSWDGASQDNFDVYVKLVGPELPVRLTTHTAQDISPAWSPDGRSIAWLRVYANDRADLLSMPVLGGGERKIAGVQAPRTADFGSGQYVAWSLDSRSLITSDTANAGAPFSLFAFSLDSGERRQVTFPPVGLIGDATPAFAPDGQTLAFARFQQTSSSDLFLVKLSKSLTATGEPSRLTHMGDWINGPVWDREGRSVIFRVGWHGGYLGLWRVRADFSSTPQKITPPSESSYLAAIAPQRERLVYSRRMRDSNVWRLDLPAAEGPGRNPVNLLNSSGGDLHPAISPDGRRIAFWSTRSGTGELWVCHADGSRAMPLTTAGATFEADTRPYPGAAWSPDSRRLVFSSRLAKQWEIFTIDAGGGSPVRITHEPADDLSPAWSHDGQWIYFSSNRSGNLQIWRMRANGTGAVQVTTDGGYAPSESPDGRFIYYLKERKSPASLWRVPTTGGAEQIAIASVAHEQSSFAIATEGIYWMRHDEQGAHWSIQYLHFANNQVSTVWNATRPLTMGLTASPDGRYLLFSQIDYLNDDLVLVENFR